MQCYVYVMHHLILSQNTANSDVRFMTEPHRCVKLTKSQY